MFLHMLLALLLLPLMSADANANASPATSSSQPSPALLVFGDSTIDVGNSNFIPTTPFFANFFPFGLDFIPLSRRFSNGRVIPDFLAEYMGIRSPPPYLANFSNIAEGVSFATGGAGILNYTFKGLTIPLLAQLDQLKLLVQKGVYDCDSLSRALVFVLIGGNDFIATLVDPSPEFGNYTNLVADIARTYEEFLRGLFALGARKLILCNLPRLGCLPLIRALLGTGEQCYEPFNELTRITNEATAQAAANFAYSLGPMIDTVRIVSVDLYGLFKHVDYNFDKYGFVSLNACCGGPPPINGLIKCGKSLIINGSLIYASRCPNAKKFAYWDSVHGTEASYELASVNMWFGGSFTLPAGGVQSLFQ